jgi:hypothetical protein
VGEAGEIAGHDQGACWVSVVRKTDTLALGSAGLQARVIDLISGTALAVPYEKLVVPDAIQL